MVKNLKIYKNMKSILFMPDELYVYNINHSYRRRKSTRKEVLKKIEDTIYVYYDLYMSTKEFDIKNKKEYRNVAAMRMIEKLSILACELLKTGISKKEFIEYFEHKINREEAIALIKKNTRNYAKRQLTFIRHQFPVEFYQDTSDLLRIINND